MLIVEQRKSIWVFTQFLEGNCSNFILFVYAVYPFACSCTSLRTVLIRPPTKQHDIQAFSILKFNIQLKQNGKIPATQHGIRFVWCEFHNLKCCFVFTFGIALCFHWTFVKMVFLCAKMMLCVIVLLKFHQRGKF